METFSVLLALCAGNSPVTGEFPSQRPVTRSFDILFDLRLDKQLSKQSRGWQFKTESCSLWRHCNDQPKPNWHTHPPTKQSKKRRSHNVEIYDLIVLYQLRSWHIHKYYFFTHGYINKMYDISNGILKYISVDEDVWNSITISLKPVLRDPVEQKSLVHVMAWGRTSNN